MFKSVDGLDEEDGLDDEDEEEEEEEEIRNELLFRTNIDSVVCCCPSCPIS